MANFDSYNIYTLGTRLQRSWTRVVHLSVCCVRTCVWACVCMHMCAYVQTRDNVRFIKYTFLLYWLGLLEPIYLTEKKGVPFLPRFFRLLKVVARCSLLRRWEGTSRGRKISYLRKKIGIVLWHCSSQGAAIEHHWRGDDARDVKSIDMRRLRMVLFDNDSAIIGGWASAPSIFLSRLEWPPWQSRLSSVARRGHTSRCLPYDGGFVWLSFIVCYSLS